MTGPKVHYQNAMRGYQAVGMAEKAEGIQQYIDEIDEELCLLEDTSWYKAEEN